MTVQNRMCILYSNAHNTAAAGYVYTTARTRTPPPCYEHGTNSISIFSDESLAHLNKCCPCSKVLALTQYRAFTETKKQSPNTGARPNNTLWYSARAGPFAAPDDPLLATGQQGSPPRVPTAFQDSKCIRRELKRRQYQVRARYQVRATALLTANAFKGALCA